MDSGLSLRAYARSRRARGLDGGTPSAVSKALKTGRIRYNRFGKIDQDQADRDWSSNTKAPAPPARETRSWPEVPGPRPRNGAAIEDGDDGPDYNRERARSERAKADKAELELAVRAGELVLAEDALRAFGEQIAAAKNILRGRARTLTEEISRVGGVQRGKMNAVAMAIEKSDASILRELAGASAES